MKINKDIRHELYRLGVLFSDIINSLTVAVGIIFLYWAWYTDNPVMTYGQKPLPTVFISIGVIITGIIGFLSGRNYFKNLGIKLITTYIWSCSITIIIGIVLTLFNVGGLFYQNIHILFIISAIIFLIRFVGENYSEIKERIKI